MNCWFAGDVTAAMKIVKNKSIFLRWVLNSLFSIFSIIGPQHSGLVTWSQTKKFSFYAFPFVKTRKTCFSESREAWRGELPISARDGMAGEKKSKWCN